MFGRCEIINIPRETDKKDYQVFAHNYIFKDLVNNNMQISLPKESYFVLNNIGILCNSKPYNSPSNGMIADIAFLMLSAYRLSIKIIDENGRIFYPINKIPLDLLTSPDRYSSVTSYSKFDLIDIFGHGLVLKSSNTNYVIVEKEVEDILNDVLIPNFPSVPIETLQEYQRKAEEFLNSSVYITLNGYFSKNIYAYVDSRDTVDLKSSKFKRIAISKNISPKVSAPYELKHILTFEESNQYGGEEEEKLPPAISNPDWNPCAYTINGTTVESNLDSAVKILAKHNLGTGATTYASAELIINLPKFSYPLLIRDLAIYFTYIPELIVLPTNPQKLYNSVFQGSDNALYLGTMKYTDSEGNEKIIDYSMIESMPVIDSSTGNEIKSLFSYRKKNGEITETIMIPHAERYYIPIYPTRIFQGKIEFSDSRRNWNINVPFVAKAIGDDYVVTLTPFDKIIFQNYGLLGLVANAANGETNESYVNTSGGDTIELSYSTTNKHKYAYELFEDEYHIGIEKLYFNKNISFGFTNKEHNKKVNSSYVLAIEPNVQVTIKVSVPYHLLPSISRFHMFGYLYEG